MAPCPIGLGGGKWLRDVVALRGVAAKIAQEGKLGGAFHSLCGCFQTRRRVDDAGHEYCGGVVGIDGINEWARPVILD